MKFAAILLFAWSAFAGVERGDIAVARYQPGAFINTWLRVYSPDGREKFIFSDVNRVAFDGTGNLYAMRDFEKELLKFDATFTLVRSVRIDAPGLMTVSEAGVVYVLSNQQMSVYSPELELLDRYMLPYGALMIDLAPDQCTLVLAVLFTKRFDVCAKRDLAGLGVNTVSVNSASRALSDGGYVIASPPRLIFSTKSGSIARVTNMEASDFFTIYSMSFDADPHYLWLAYANGFVRKVEITTGAVVQSLSMSVTSIAVFGEMRPSSLDVAPTGRREAVRHPRH
jgi:hypothetical protein